MKLPAAELRGILLIKMTERSDFQYSSFANRHSKSSASNSDDAATFNNG
jgi:hypothetical protein